MRRLSLLCCLFALQPASAAAQLEPGPAPMDPRVQVVDYHADQVVLLQAAPGYQMTIEFGDERIDNVAVGDSGAWQVTPNRRGDFLFIKPLQSAATNMTVVTDARVYLFELSPLQGAGSDMPYTVRFRYPAAQSSSGVEVETASAETVEGRYRVTGNRSLRPNAISDDGVHTYIEWAGDRDLPAVFAEDAGGRETLVNGMMRDGLFVIDEVVPRLVFRIDRREARAVRVTTRARS